MAKKITLKDLSNEPGCLAEYDPNAMQIESAKKLISNFLEPIKDTESVNLIDSLNRVLALDLVSPISVPNYNNSAMDGFGFNISSLKNTKTLIVKNTVLAGKPINTSIKNGEAIQIMTGGKIPKGVDTVIPIELVKYSNNQITFIDIPKIGSNIRKCGEDIKQKDIVLDKGTQLYPAELGLIASLGLTKVKVIKKLKVAFFSTGDEIVKAGGKIKSGQVYNSNHFTIHSMLNRLNVECIDLGLIPDSKIIIKNTLLKASKVANVIITTGGVSVGEADYMKEVLKEIGQVLFWKLSIKPGRPMAYGKINNTDFFGLPGNPVSAMVTFYQIVQSALKIRMGLKIDNTIPLLKVECVESIFKRPGRTEFQRGKLFQSNGEWKVKTTGQQGSGILSSMSKANCFIVLDMDRSSIKAGDMVNIQLMDSFI
ncbi:molybdopterin molybdotransferase MoeA [Methylophilaceae bacterium]|jgi:molybdopterin molybdotransferase|nr:molybdopterin molybdotransferase MoeA [Methylophilaceae bacterium]